MLAYDGALDCSLDYPWSDPAGLYLIIMRRVHEVPPAHNNGRSAVLDTIVRRSSPCGMRFPRSFPFTSSSIWGGPFCVQVSSIFNTELPFQGQIKEIGVRPSQCELSFQLSGICHAIASAYPHDCVLFLPTTAGEKMMAKTVAQ